MESFGKYEVVEKIGAGGFGEVFKAYDALLKRHVAVKTCSSPEERVRRRFFREAEIAGSLHHSNITTVFDFGTEGDTPYLVQEFLGGEDLDHVIRRRDSVRFERKLLWLLQVANGLRHAHAKGVVHRDIKPGNVRVLEDGSAKIMDFGIARLVNQESTLTRTGVTVGTAAYLAPEQVRGEAVDARTDIFAFGVLAYELITWVRPFHDESLTAMLYAIVSKDPEPMSTHWPECPAEADRVIARCLAKEPDDRYADCGELADDLGKLRDHARAMNTLAEPRRQADIPTRQLASRAEVGPSPAPAAVGDAGVGDIELVSAVPRSRQGERRTPGGRRPLGALLGAVLLAGLAAGVWWWLGKQGNETAEGGETQAAVGAEETAATPLPGGPGESSDAPAGEPGAAASQPETRDLSAGPGSSPPVEEAAQEIPEEAPEAVAVPVEPQAPPPEPPPPTRLILPQAWSSGLLVSIDGAPPRPLTRELALDVSPGRHQLAFELSTVDYSADETITVEVAEGSSRRVEIPLARPGALTVQSFMGTPQGAIRVDGQEIGASPLERRYASPGSYRLEIAPPPGSGLEPISRGLEIRSGVELIVNFDLTGGRELKLIERAVAPP